MSNNTFNGKRFLLLWKQHFIHNTQFLILSSVVYVGIIFLVLSMAQIISRDFKPHDPSSFLLFLLISHIIFGILYVGHAFPAFRSKESSITYLMVPASVLEKFVFEVISRIGILLVMLPLLFWIAFHLQGYFFAAFFTDQLFEPIEMKYLITTDVIKGEYVTRVIAKLGILLVVVLLLTGAATFEKQPLIKTLFSVILIFLFYLAYAYIMVVHVGVRNYAAPEDLWLFPTDELKALWWLCGVLVVAIAVMLFVGYRKLKEKEV